MKIRKTTKNLFTELIFSTRVSTLISFIITLYLYILYPHANLSVKGTLVNSIYVSSHFLLDFVAVGIIIMPLVLLITFLTDVFVHLEHRIASNY